MRIGLISDTHDRVEYIDKAVKIFSDVDLVIHTGDWCSPFFLLDFVKKIKAQVKTVFGNNDADIFRLMDLTKGLDIEFLGDFAEIEIENRKYAVLHGDPESIIDSLALSNKYDVIFHGHTHKARIEKIKDTVVLNPGSFMPRSRKKWTKPSVAVFDSDKLTGEIKILE
ncbi:YfcE family phosphodiesterase [Candidatus Woesearchaeota archaeon]|nr:YfcE family phosphodiesterase [Candidatus Woesearchaeota archaeon]